MTFDVADHLHGLRCRETSWLVARRDELVREQRRARVEELAVIRVLDERGRAADELAADPGLSERDARATVETARALESLPAVAAAAHAGLLSDAQLGPVAALADEGSDAEWAERAPNIAPADLSTLARTRSKPTVEDSRRRYEARSLRMWWDRPHAMLHLRGALPDLMGAELEQTINALTEQMKPSKGQAWDSYEHRAADALHTMCRRTSGSESDSERDTTKGGTRAAEHRPSLAPKAVLVVEVPTLGAATIAGIPIPDAMVEQLRANATIEAVLVDPAGLRIATGRRRSVLSSKLTRAVLLRDGHCRWPGCEHRHGLEIHHLTPVSCGGTDHVANLAVVCAPHHRQLVPHGPWVLTGNPNQPDGLRLLRYDQLTRRQARDHDLPPPPTRRE